MNLEIDKTEDAIRELETRSYEDMSRRMTDSEIREAARRCCFASVPMKALHDFVKEIGIYDIREEREKKAETESENSRLMALYP